MSVLKQLAKATAELSQDEDQRLKDWGVIRQEDGITNIRRFDMLDITRLVIYRRAVQAGYYSDGPADESWVVNPKGNLGSLVVA